MLTDYFKSVTSDSFFCFVFSSFFFFTNKPTVEVHMVTQCSSNWLTDLVSWQQRFLVEE